MSKENNHPSCIQQLFYGFTNLALFLAGIFNLFIGSVAAYHDKMSISTTSLTAGLILLFASTIDRFESLKGLGVEAKTRKLDEKIAQADDMLEHLRNLAELTVQELIDKNARIGRWINAPKPIENYELAERTRRVLEKLGTDDQTIKKLLEPWVRVTLIDLTISIINPVRNAVNEEMNAVGRKLADHTDPEYASYKERHDTFTKIFSDLNSDISKFHHKDLLNHVSKLLETIKLEDMKPVETAKSNILEFLPLSLELIHNYKLVERDKWFAQIDPIFEG